MGPLSVTYTSLQMPMSLSGGIGFQSTQLKASSCGSGAATAMASALRAPARACFVTSRSWRRKVPTTSLAAATRSPFSQTSAR